MENVSRDLPYLEKTDPWSSHSLIVRWLSSVPDGSKVLDVGCASGTIGHRCAGKNLFLTALANITFRRYLTEVHSGFRAYSRKYLETVRFEENSDDFVFDTETIAQGMACDLFFSEVPIVTRCFPEASSINFKRSAVYGFGISCVLIKYTLHASGLMRLRQLTPNSPA